MPTRDVVLIALFAALMAVLGVVPAVAIPLINVPITAQSMGVMLAGGVLGARRAALALLLFTVLVLLGLPLLAGGRGGPGVLFGPTVGFFLGWIPAAAVTGALIGSPRAGGLAFARVLAAVVLGGIVVLYACGILGLSIVADIPMGRAALASAAFLPADLLKAGVAAAIIVNVAKGRPPVAPRPPCRGCR